jgi:hypothetical protein
MMESTRSPAAWLPHDPMRAPGRSKGESMDYGLAGRTVILTGAARGQGAAEPVTVHGLVNNAGVPYRARLLTVDLASRERVVGVNLTGAMLGMRAIAPVMASDGTAAIVNIGTKPISDALARAHAGDTAGDSTGESTGETETSA